MEYNVGIDRDIEEQPMIPVRLFKEYELFSVPRGEIVKTMTSSGTSGQKVSKIFLDKINVKNQTRVLTGIITSYIGGKRLMPGDRAPAFLFFPDCRVLPVIILPVHPSSRFIPFFQKALFPPFYLFYINVLRI